METELKLRFLREDGPKLLSDVFWLRDLVMPESTIVREMYSTYFDTADHDLLTIKASLRIRKEGDVHVVTIKRGDGFTDPGSGLHQRMEWSVELDEDEEPETFFKVGFDVDWFLRCSVSEGDPDEALREVLALLDGKPLVEICQANFTRESMDVGYGDTLMELSVDTGELIAGDKRESICELEIELKEGDARDLFALGEELAGSLPLEPESRSKYGRCLNMLDYA